MKENKEETKLQSEQKTDILDTVIGLIDLYWSFDDNQRHTHNWHDKQDCIEKIRSYWDSKQKEFKSEPSPIEGVENKFLLHLVDVVARFATEQNIFYATKTRMELIQKAIETFKGNG